MGIVTWVLLHLNCISAGPIHVLASVWPAVLILGPTEFAIFHTLDDDMRGIKVGLIRYGMSRMPGII